MLVREPLEQLGLSLERELVGEAKRARVLIPRLSMCTQVRRTRAGGGCVAQDGVGVAGRVRMVRQPGEVRDSSGRCGERGDGTLVERSLPVRRNRFLDRQPGEIVPERDRVGLGVEHPRRQALLELG